MTTNNFIPLRIIRFFLIVALLSNLACSSSKPKKIESMASAIDNYIESYKDYNFDEPLSTIMISTKLEDGKIIYIINDAPEKFFFGRLNKYEKNQNELYMGYYKNIPCTIQSDSLQNFKHLFNEINANVINRAKQAALITDKDGKKSISDLTKLNWTSQLIIIYNTTDNTKRLITSK